MGGDGVVCCDLKGHNVPSRILSQNISLRRQVGCIVWWGLEMKMAEAEPAPCTGRVLLIPMLVNLVSSVHCIECCLHTVSKLGSY